MSSLASLKCPPTAVTMAEAAPVIDLFAGCGGLSIGLARAGFSIEAAVEIEADACSTFASLHTRAALYDDDIARIDFKQFRGEIRLVAAGVPCQPFSSGESGWPRLTPGMVSPSSCVPFVRLPRTPYLSRMLPASPWRAGEVISPRSSMRSRTSASRRHGSASMLLITASRKSASDSSWLDCVAASSSSRCQRTAQGARTR